jgi:hypothetical protein
MLSVDSKHQKRKTSQFRAPADPEVAVNSEERKAK